MNAKTKAIAHGKFKGAAGSNNADTFFKSADGGSQLANMGNHKSAWGADGDPTTTDTTSPATGSPTVVTPVIATPSSTGCGCAQWHKPSCFVGGLLIGGLITYFIFKNKE